MADCIQEVILHEIIEAIDTVNDELPAGLKLRAELDSRLTGIGRELDSLGLILLLTEIEARLSKALNITFSFEDIIAESDDSPYQTVRSLYDLAVQSLDGDEVHS